METDAFDGRRRKKGETQRDSTPFQTDSPSRPTALPDRQSFTDTPSSLTTPDSFRPDDDNRRAAPPPFCSQACDLVTRNAWD